MRVSLKFRLQARVRLELMASNSTSGLERFCGKVANLPSARPSHFIWGHNHASELVDFGLARD